MSVVFCRGCQRERKKNRLVPGDPMFSWTEERGTYSASRNTNKVNSRSVRIIKLPKKRQTLAGKKRQREGHKSYL